jgi:flagellar biosynthetic protein FlhB
MSGDKRFPPSAKKLRKARENGDYARSRHLSGFIATALGALILLRTTWHLNQPPRGLLQFTPEASLELYGQVWSISRSWVPLICETLAAVALLWTGIILSELAQSRGHIHGSILRFDILAMSPMRGLKRMLNIDDEFSISGVVVGYFRTLFVALLKIAVVGVVVGYLIHLWFSVSSNPDSIAVKLQLTVYILGGLALGVTAVTGIVDLLWSIKKRNQRLMMDYNEMIQDLKENEGNQEMKAMRRRAHQEILREADINRVRAAKVLLTD